MALADRSARLFRKRIFRNFVPRGGGETGLRIHRGHAESGQAIEVSQPDSSAIDFRNHGKQNSFGDRRIGEAQEVGCVL